MRTLPLFDAKRGQKIFTDRNAFFTILGVVFIYSIKNFFLKLYMDEVYYWVWSKNLALSYYDHPPMIAYFIRAFTLISDARYFVRMAAVFSMIICLWYTYKLAKHVFDRQTAWLALFIMFLLPGLYAGSTVVTPDSPLMMFWAMTAWFGLKAIEKNTWKDHILLALCGGAMMLSKYTSVLYFAALILFIALKYPRKLYSLKMWTAAVLTLLVFSPVVIWNQQNDWISFSFQYQHGTSSAWHIDWGVFFGFVGSLILAFTPVFAWALGYYLMGYKRYWKKPREMYLICVSMFPLGFFLYKGLFKEMGLNWAAMVFVTAPILIASVFRRKPFRKTFITGAAICVILLVFLTFPAQLLPDHLNFHSRIYGLEEMAEKAVSYLEPGDALMADRPAQAGMFTYKAPGHPRCYIPLETRINQYTIWDRDTDMSKLSGIFFAHKDKSEALQNVFGDRFTLLEEIKPEQGKKKYFIYRILPDKN